MKTMESERQEAQKLYDQGYRQISRKFGIVSRVDIPHADMLRFFEQQGYGGTSCGVASLSMEDQRNHYRRRHSKDQIEGVSYQVLRELRRITERKE